MNGVDAAVVQAAENLDAIKHSLDRFDIDTRTATGINVWPEWKKNQDLRDRTRKRTKPRRRRGGRIKQALIPWQPEEIEANLWVDTDLDEPPEFIPGVWTAIPERRLLSENWDAVKDETEWDPD